MLFENIPFFCNPCNFSSFFAHLTLFSSSLKWYSSFYRFFEDDDVMTLTTVVLLLQQNFQLGFFVKKINSNHTKLSQNAFSSQKKLSMKIGMIYSVCFSALTFLSAHFSRNILAPSHERRRMSDFNSIGIWLLSFLKHIQVFHEFQMPH